MLKPFAQAFAYASSNYQSTPGAASAGQTVTGGNSANGTAVGWTPGALAFDVQVLLVRWYSGGLTNTDTRSLIDILVDPAGGTSWSSTPLITGLLAGFGGAAANSGWRTVMAPVRIASGTNLGFQARSLTAGRSHNVVLTAWGGYKGPGAWRCGSRVISYGVDEANYNGTLVTPGASGAWGSWTSIGSATNTNLFCFNIIYGGVNGSSMSGHGLYFQMGAGSKPFSSLNDEDAPHMFTINSTSENITQHQSWPIFVDVPDGTQLQARGKNSTTSPQASGIAIYAVTG